MWQLRGSRQLFISIVGGVLFLCGIALYAHLDRTEGSKLVPAIILSFSGYFLLLLSIIKLNKTPIAAIFILGLLARFLFLADTPKLSDDFFRYAWDGKLMEMGIDPYSSTPEQLLESAGEAQSELTAYKAQLKTDEFPNGLNSPSYYSVYPPFAQLLFRAAHLGAQDQFGEVYGLKAIYMLFEIGSFILFLLVLPLYKQNPLLVVVYWFNPLIITEFVGNLHLEGIAVFFLLLTFYLIQKRRLLMSAIPLSVAIATKLNPLFLVLVANRAFTVKKYFFWSAITGLLVLLYFTLVTDLSGLKHIYSSVRLYNYWFEYNAGIFYLLLELHISFPGNNIVGMFNFLLPAILLGGLALLSFLPKNAILLERFFLAYLFYLLISKVVHPWYLIPLIALTPFVKWRFALIWSFMISFTYLSYSFGNFDELGGLILTEYIVLFIILFWEFYLLPRKLKTKLGQN
jgi:alpha-1,6-mannosyltransferase